MEKYRDSGLKLTPQRLAILEYLDGNKEHPSAEDVYKAVSKNRSAPETPRAQFKIFP